MVFFRHCNPRLVLSVFPPDHLVLRFEGLLMMTPLTLVIASIRQPAETKQSRRNTLSRGIALRRLGGSR